jgi:hypothetical protein
MTGRRHRESRRRYDPGRSLLLVCPVCGGVIDEKAVEALTELPTVSNGPERDCVRLPHLPR